MWQNPLRSFCHIGSADYIRRTVSRNTIPTMFQKNSLIFLLLILINCSKESKDEFKRKENFIRDWKVIRYPYSNAILSIYANHEFKYSETGHLSESYSEGIWDLNNDTLTLNSLQPNECLIIDDFSLNISENYDKMRMTSKNCEPKPNSKIFTEFINAKFLIKKDSLKLVVHYQIRFIFRLFIFLSKTNLFRY